MRRIHSTSTSSRPTIISSKQAYITVSLLAISIYLFTILRETKWITSALSDDAALLSRSAGEIYGVPTSREIMNAPTDVVFTYRHNFSYDERARSEPEKQVPRRLLTVDKPPSAPRLEKRRQRYLLCSVCTDAKLSTTQQSCSQLIFQQEDSSTLSWSQLMVLQRNVSQVHPIDCAACDPATCRPTMDEILSFDDAAPQILRSVSHLLPSVPFQYQRPYSKHNNNHTHTNATTAHQQPDSLVFYNPSILTFDSPDLPEAVFIASFRGSVNEYPFIKEDLVAIALLDKDLKILRDVVVDPNAFLRVVHTDLAPSITFYDYRLFYLHGQLYLTDAQLLLRIEVHLSAANKKKDNMTLPVIFGGESLSITAPYGYHYLFQHNGKRLSGKNLALIEHPNGRSAYIELWPVPRTLLEVNLTNGVRFSYATPEVVRYPPTPLLPSHASHETQHIFKKPFKFTKDRGTACCVTLEYEYFKDLLVLTNNTIMDGADVRIGISHAKSRLPIPDLGYGYLSRFYAVAANDPYHVVAMSALFCLSWHDGDWKDARPQSHLKIKQFVYDCPMVHFPSGIASSPKANPTRIVVGYGIQDRQSRFVEFSKREVALHIFSPLPNND